MSVIPQPPEKKPITRHDFLALAWKGLLGMGSLFGLGGLWRFLSYQPEPIPVTRYDLGLLTDLPQAARLPIPEAQAVLMRVGDTLTAYSLVCPHLGCTADMTPEGYTCPCHGSRFDSEGKVVHGPANKPMNKLAVEVREDGHVILDTSKIYKEETAKQPIQLNATPMGGMYGVSEEEPQKGAGSRGEIEP